MYEDFVLFLLEFIGYRDTGVFSPFFFSEEKNIEFSFFVNFFFGKSDNGFNILSE